MRKLRGAEFQHLACVGAAVGDAAEGPEPRQRWLVTMTSRCLSFVLAPSSCYDRLVTALL